MVNKTLETRANVSEGAVDGGIMNKRAIERVGWHEGELMRKNVSQ